jgi:hypothetical protein
MDPVEIRVGFAPGPHPFLGQERRGASAAAAR